MLAGVVVLQGAKSADLVSFPNPSMATFRKVSFIKKTKIYSDESIKCCYIII
jgi:hypothetical protein